MNAIDPAEVRVRLDVVIEALKATGAWDVERPSDEALVDAGPFGMHKLAFEQWLRYVFVARVEELLAANGPWPEHSMIAAHATREWDGHPNADDMLRALRAFDALFEPDEPAAADSLNWLGWRFIGRENDRAIAYFRAAIQARPRWGLAHLNLARALENADRDDEWYAEFQAALACEDDFDRAYCHERIATYRARRGQFREALESLHAALAEDDKRGGERRALHVEALAWVEQQLAAKVAFHCPKCSSAIEFDASADDRTAASCPGCSLRFSLGELRRID